MFDGLKDKISGFKEEVDEEVEAEEVEVEEEEIEEEIEKEIEEEIEGEVDDELEEELEKEIHEEVEALKQSGIEEGREAAETEERAEGESEREETTEKEKEEESDVETKDGKLEAETEDEPDAETEDGSDSDSSSGSGGRFGGIKKKASSIVSKDSKKETEEEDGDSGTERDEGEIDEGEEGGTETEGTEEKGETETEGIEKEGETETGIEGEVEKPGGEKSEDERDTSEDGEDGGSTRRGKIAKKAKGVVSKGGASEDEDAAEGMEEDVGGDEIEGEDDVDPDEIDEATRRGRIKRKAKTLMGDRAFVIDEDSLEKPLRDLEMALLSNDVEMDVAQDILNNMREDLLGEKKHWRESKSEIIMDALRDALLDVLSVEDVDFEGYLRESEKPVVIIFTGVNGVGKTTTIAKLSKYLEGEGFSTVWANGDTYRAGANEQIEEHAENLDKKLIKHEKGGDPAAVIYDAVEYAEANDIDVVLGDTAGRLHTSQDLMDQLEKIDRVVDPDLNIFVDESVAGQDAVNRAEEFKEAADTDAVILTKADADSSGGAAISVARVTGEPILFLGVGQGYDDLEKFEPRKIVDEIVGEDETPMEA